MSLRNASETKHLHSQYYATIHSRHLKTRSLFEDPTFLCNSESLSKKHRSFGDEIQWVRAKDVVKNACFISDSTSRFSINQGSLDDCWLLAAISTLTLNQSLFSQVVPPNQNFNENYAGVFYFRFWQFGTWMEVTVDDRLPMMDGKLLYLSHDKRSELWPALLEKAYAKLYGSYQALNSGNTAEAMEDFTGGITETINLDVPQATVLKLMLTSYTLGSMMGCSITCDSTDYNLELENGLICNHAYSVTCIRKVDISTPNIAKGKIYLVRLRNPWGDLFEWNGPFSDGSVQWTCISEETKREIDLSFKPDGEFWMTFQDFYKAFSVLEICHMSPDHVGAINTKKQWKMSKIEGAWISGLNAGGCINKIDSYATNPQYTLELYPDTVDADCRYDVVIALMQKSRRNLSTNKLSIGFDIYKHKSPSAETLERKYFLYNAPVAATPTYKSIRQVIGRHQLIGGVYCIIPSTFSPNENGEFLLRFYSEVRTWSHERQTHILITPRFSSALPQLSQSSEVYDKLVFQLFQKSAGSDCLIDWLELQQTLDDYCRKYYKFGGFSKDTCRCLLSMVDADQSSRLDIAEFRQLWTYIHECVRLFSAFDGDQSGHLNALEIKSLLSHCGVPCDSKMICLILRRYGDTENRVEFDDFVALHTKITTCKDFFENLRSSDSDSMIVDLNQWFYYNLNL